MTDAASSSLLWFGNENWNWALCASSPLSVTARSSVIEVKEVATNRVCSSVTMSMAAWYSSVMAVDRDVGLTRVPWLLCTVVRVKPDYDAQIHRGSNVAKRIYSKWAGTSLSGPVYPLVTYEKCRVVGFKTALWRRQAILNLPHSLHMPQKLHVEVFSNFHYMLLYARSIVIIQHFVFLSSCFLQHSPNVCAKSRIQKKKHHRRLKYSVPSFSFLQQM